MDKNNIYQESVKEKLTFSPIDKYVKYDRFPFKLLIHILLVILTTIAAISMATGSNSVFKSQRTVWFKLVNLDPVEPRNHLYTINQLQDHLNLTVTNLNALETIVFQDIQKNETKYTLSVEYLYPGSHLDQNVSREFQHQGNIFKYDIPDIINGITCPFLLNDTNSLKTFAQQVKSFTFNADNLRLKQSHGDHDIYSCWKLHLEYTMASYSHVMVELTTLQKNCELDEENNQTNFQSGIFLNAQNRKIKKGMFITDPHGESNPFGSILLFMNILICVLAFCSMILNWRYIYEMMNLYMDTRIRSKRKDIKKMNEIDEDDTSYLAQMVAGAKGEKSLEKLLESQKPWDQLTFREKLLFFDMWFVFCIIGNFIQIWASILSATVDFDVETYKTKSLLDVLVGFSCWFAWLNLLRYLEYNKDIHLLTNVMRNSGPQILRFMIGFLPIFFGYVFLGVCLFWRYTKFESVNEAIITLFSLIMGDLVFTTFTDVIGVGIIGEIYLFSFVVLFIVCVHNIFVSIICSKAQEKKKPLAQKPATAQIPTPSLQTFQQTQQMPPGPVYCDCCKKLIQKQKETNPPENEGDKTNREKQSDSMVDAESNRISGNDKLNISRTASKKVTGTAWENIAKSQIKKFMKSEDKTQGLFLNKYEKLEDVKKKMFDQMMLHRKEINFLLDDMRKDAIEDVELYELKLGQKIALKKKYKQQMEYLKSKIKSLLDPLKL